MNLEESCSCLPLNRIEVMSPFVVCTNAFTCEYTHHDVPSLSAWHLLVVTRPAPESTTMLVPEVVTPNAAKATGK